MDWIGGAVQAIAALDNAGKAWVFAIVMACGTLVSLVVAWRKGYFRSHTDLVSRQREVADDLSRVRAGIVRLEQDLAALHGRVDVIAVDQAGYAPVLKALQREVGEMSRTTRRLSREVARVSGATDTMLQMMQREPTPPGGNRLFERLDETPDPDGRR